MSNKQKIIFPISLVYRDGTLSPEEARKMIERVQEDMMKSKEKMDAEKERQEQALHKKLSERKKQKVAELVRGLESH